MSLLTIGFGDTFQLVFLLDGVTVGRTLGRIDQLVGCKDEVMKGEMSHVKVTCVGQTIANERTYDKTRAHAGTRTRIYAQTLSHAQTYEHTLTIAHTLAHRTN